MFSVSLFLIFLLFHLLFSSNFICYFHVYKFWITPLWCSKSADTDSENLFIHKCEADSYCLLQLPTSQNYRHNSTLSFQILMIIASTIRSYVQSVHVSYTCIFINVCTSRYSEKEACCWSVIQQRHGKIHEVRTGPSSSKSWHNKGESKSKWGDSGQ